MERRRSPAWAGLHPMPTAAALEGAPHDHDVISEGAPLVLGRQIGKCREVPLVGGTHRRPLLTPQAQGVGLKKTVLTEAARIASMSRATSASRCLSKRRCISSGLMAQTFSCDIAYSERPAASRASGWSWQTRTRAPKPSCGSCHEMRRSNHHPGVAWLRIDGDDTWHVGDQLPRSKMLDSERPGEGLRSIRQTPSCP